MKYDYLFYISDCGKYDMINAGGVIDFEMINSIKDFEYDCTWIVKKQPDYDRMYLKILKFRTDLMGTVFKMTDSDC